MKFLVALLASILGSLICALPSLAVDKQIVGWVERVRLQPGNVLLEAKLDTGAEYCSLDATHITKFSRDGQEWVRFEVDDHHGKTFTMERPLLRQATIKRHFSASQSRPVIRLQICVGNVVAETDVNLVDRHGFIYPLLIGRKFMEGRLIIDPTAKHTVEPTCPEQPVSE
ncbi:MAG: RimK/LysX family protein [Deltaproteobacteria bacterium]|nr:RimK/LysX family protein [Deltaproteobacteria bacterium]